MSATVLIVDDSMVVRAFLKKQLASESFDVVEVESGEAALEIARRTPPDVVLLDVEMPGISGYDVLESMQGDATLSQVPVIFLSGRVSASDVATGLRLGAYDYLRKPVETGELVARITKALQTKAMYDKLQEDKPNRSTTSTTDSLTGVLDIAGLQAQLSEMAVAVREGRPLSAVLVDVNGLALINEQHGQAAGDQVLRAVATLVTERVGHRDVVGRCGPDEFIVLLPDIGVAEAEVMAGELRDAVDRSPALGAGPLSASITVGVAATTTGDLRSLFLDLESELAMAKGGTATVVEQLPPPPDLTEPDPTEPDPAEPVPAEPVPAGDGGPSDGPTPAAPPAAGWATTATPEPSPSAPPRPAPSPPPAASPPVSAAPPEPEPPATIAPSPTPPAPTPPAPVQPPAAQPPPAAPKPPVLALPNVPGLQEQLAQLADLVRRGRPIAAALLHVVGLAHVKEVHGKGIGEQVRRVATNLITQQLKEGDVVGSWSEEEVIVFLPEADLDAAQLIASKVRTAIESSPAVGRAGLGLSLRSGAAATRNGDVDSLLRDVEADLAAAD